MASRRDLKERLTDYMLPLIVAEYESPPSAFHGMRCITLHPMIFVELDDPDDDPEDPLFYKHCLTRKSKMKGGGDPVFEANKVPFHVAVFIPRAVEQQLLISQLQQHGYSAKRAKILVKQKQMRSMSELPDLSGEEDDDMEEEDADELLVCVIVRSLSPGH